MTETVSASARPIVVVSSSVGVLGELRAAAAAHTPAGGVTLVAPVSGRPDAGGRLGDDALGIHLIALPPRVERSARRRLERHVVGRTLLRLSPWDRGRQFARTVARSTEARAALAGAGALVAADRDAVLAVWRTARRADPSVRALFGLAAGTALIRRA